MPEWTKTNDRPVRIAFLLFDQFSNICMANCLEPLRAANTQTRALSFDWRILTPDGAPVQSSSAVQILPHGPVSGLARCDYLFVLSSYDHERHDTPANRRLLRAASKLAGVSIGLDAGPWLMASAGLLAGRRATVHWDLLDRFSEKFLDVQVERARVIRDGRVMTCAGAMSALDLTMGLIAEHTGVATRLAVEALFIQGDPPVGAARDRAAAGDPLVARALAVMRENLERPLSLAALARRLSCQPRTLSRHFRARLGAPPGTVYRHLRLAAARTLLDSSALGIAEIALRCGYASPAALSRAVGRLYGDTPTGLRAEHPLDWRSDPAGG